MMMMQHQDFVAEGRRPGSAHALHDRTDAGRRKSSSTSSSSTSTLSLRPYYSRFVFGSVLMMSDRCWSSFRFRLCDRVALSNNGTRANVDAVRTMVLAVFVPLMFIGTMVSSWSSSFLVLFLFAYEYGSCICVSLCFFRFFMSIGVS